MDRSSLSGTHSNHDTVMTLIQIKPEFPPSKPKLSVFNLSRSRVNGYGKLPCQQLKPYIQKKKGLPLPSCFQVEDSVKSIIEDNDDEIKSFIINKVRESVNSDELHILTWAGCKSLISSANLPIMQVAFLPYLPHPVTDYSTVYTALCNFLSVLDQLKQDSLPLICDQGVFRIVAEITLQHPEQFKKIIPMIGNFHLAKAVEHCIGKFLEGSGFNDALVESQVFGLKTVEAVMAGTHYVRSLHGLLIIQETIECARWQGFLQIYGGENYQQLLLPLEKLKKSLQDKDADASKANCIKCMESVEPLYKEYVNFCNTAEENSELCRYWNILASSIENLKKLIAADRDGDWHGHLRAVTNLLPLFAECDSINYLRYGSLYLECMRKLPETHTQVYEQFLRGNFVVKTNPGTFNAVSPDMKLEQTIQRSQKSSKGVIGQTRQANYVSEWEVVYHEILAISNTLRYLIRSNIGNRECELHHELYGNFALNYNKQVIKVIEFVEQRGNPFTSATGIVKLHNFFSGASVVEEVARRLLNFDENSVRRYESFRKERFIDKTKMLSETIQKSNLPHFATQSQEEGQKKSQCDKEVAKEVAHIQKLIDIAKSRHIPTSEILEYDLLGASPLFEGTRKTRACT